MTVLRDALQPHMKPQTARKPMGKPPSPGGRVYHPWPLPKRKAWNLVSNVSFGEQSTNLLDHGPPDFWWTGRELFSWLLVQAYLDSSGYLVSRVQRRGRKVGEKGGGMNVGRTAHKRKAL